MRGHELAAALHLGMSTFYKYQAQGHYESLEVAPRVGPRRYSRRAVQDYLDRKADGPVERPALTPVRLRAVRR